MSAFGLFTGFLCCVRGLLVRLGLAAVLSKTFLFVVLFGYLCDNVLMYRLVNCPFCDSLPAAWLKSLSCASN